NVSSGSAQALHQAGSNRVTNIDPHDRNRARCALRSPSRGRAVGKEYIDLERYELIQQCWEISISRTRDVAPLDLDVLPFRIAVIPKTRQECITLPDRRRVGGVPEHKPEARNVRTL